MANEQTINVPQLLLAILLGGLAIRYFFFSGPANELSRIPSSADNIRAREADVERVQQMFPQISRRTVMWDLHRNGGNIAATTERILSGRPLDTPPQTFQPPPAPVSNSSTTTPAPPAAAKPAPPDLITRYNLLSKVATQTSETEAISAGKQAWSQNKYERQALLQQRREEMILAARRKMEARIAAESATKSQ